MIDRLRFGRQSQRHRVQDARVLLHLGPLEVKVDGSRTGRGQRPGRRVDELGPVLRCSSRRFRTGGRRRYNPSSRPPPPPPPGAAAAPPAADAVAAAAGASVADVATIADAGVACSACRMGNGYKSVIGSLVRRVFHVSGVF